MSTSPLYHGFGLQFKHGEIILRVRPKGELYRRPVCKSWHIISFGRAGGTNNKIKVLKRMAYGYWDMKFFKLRIMAVHESKYALVG